MRGQLCGIFALCGVLVIAAGSGVGRARPRQLGRRAAPQRRSRNDSLLSRPIGSTCFPRASATSEHTTAVDNGPVSSSQTAKLKALRRAASCIVPPRPPAKPPPPPSDRTPPGLVRSDVDGATLHLVFDEPLGGLSAGRVGVLRQRRRPRVECRRRGAELVDRDADASAGRGRRSGSDDRLRASGCGAPEGRGRECDSRIQLAAGERLTCGSRAFTGVVLAVAGQTVVRRRPYAGGAVGGRVGPEDRSSVGELDGPPARSPRACRLPGCPRDGGALVLPGPLHGDDAAVVRGVLVRPSVLRDRVSRSLRADVAADRLVRPAQLLPVCQHPCVLPGADREDRP